MRITKFIPVLLVLTLSLFSPLSAAGEAALNHHFKLEFDHAGITSLKCTYDGLGTEHIAAGKTLGHIKARYRMGSGEWQDFVTQKMRDEWTVNQGAEDGAPQRLVVYNGSGWYDYYADLELTERFRLEDDVLFWTMHLRNLTHKPIDIADLILPLPFNQENRGPGDRTTPGRLILRQFIWDHGAYLYLKREDGQGPCLLMTPVEKCPYFEPAQTERNFKPSKLEYADAEGVYIFSAGQASGLPQRGIPAFPTHTSLKLTPKFTPGDEITYGFKFRWAEDEQKINDILYEEGLFVVEVKPGGSLASDTEAVVSLRTKKSIGSVLASFPGQTKINPLGKADDDGILYGVKFSRPGENFLRFEFSDSRRLILRFSVIKPAEPR